MAMLLYATNGRVQELPDTTQFLFWDKADFNRAFKIAKLTLAQYYGKYRGQIRDVDRQNYKIHPDVGAYLVGHAAAYKEEWRIHWLMDSISKDPCKTFVSRPVGQEVDWYQWAMFCSWYFYFHNDTGSTLLLSEDIAGGNCGRWLGQFLAKDQTFGHKWGYPFAHCVRNQSAVDALYFVDVNDFDVVRCRADVGVFVPPPPETWLETLAKWFPDASQAKKFAPYFEASHQPYDSTQHTVMAKQTPIPVDEKQLEESMGTEDKGSGVNLAIIAGIALAGIALFAVSVRK